MPNMGIKTTMPLRGVFKRRYRWTMSFTPGQTGLDPIPPMAVTIAGRPSMNIEEQELNFLNEKAWIAARPIWEPLSVTFLDFRDADGGDGETSSDAPLLKWISRTYQFGDPGDNTTGDMSDPGREYKMQGALVMYDGVGNPMEEWILYGCWCQNVNWGDLDYTASEYQTIETSIRFDNANCTLQGGRGGRGGKDYRIP